MAPFTAPDRAPVRHGQALDYESLRAEAVAAVAEWTTTPGNSRAELARELGKSPSAISRALNEVDGPFPTLLKMIVEHLTPYTVEPEHEVVYRVRRTS